MSGRREGGSSGRIAAGLCAAAAGVLLAFLLLAPHPWEVPGGPAFLATDRTRDLRANVWIGLWWASALNALALLALAATARWWARPTPPLCPPRTAARAPRLLLAATAAAVLLGVGLRLPLASKSVWWDEAWTLRHVVVGSYDVEPVDLERPEHRARFKPALLEEALFYAKKPTNHALYSVAAFGSTRLWRALHPGAPHRFSELAYRAPALLAAAATIALLAWLCAELGLARAGPLAALLFALHPLAIRYGAEGRAYGFVMAFSLLGALALLRFLRDRRFADLGLYAASQMLLVWTWSYAAFVTAGLAAASLAHVLFADARAGRSAEARRSDALRLLVANALAAMGVLQVFAPNLTLARTWGVYTGEVLSQLPEVWAGQVSGMLWRTSDMDPTLPALAERVAPGAGPLWAAGAALVFAGIPLALCLGLRGVWRAGTAPRSVALGWLAAVPLAIAVTQLTGRHFYPRFLLFGLPLCVTLVAIALDGLGARAAAGLRRTGPAAWAAGVGLVALLVLAWLGLVAPQLRLLMERPYAPLRDTAQALQAGTGATPLRAGLGFGTGALRVYDPEIRFAGGRADIARLCREARAAGRPLRVSWGYPFHNRKLAAEAALLEDVAHFTPVADLRGIEPEFHFRVYEARGPCPLDGTAPGVPSSP